MMVAAQVGLLRLSIPRYGSLVPGACEQTQDPMEG
jgi:hypothetical protein